MSTQRMSRKEQRRMALAQERRRRRMFIGAAGVIVVAAIAALALSRSAGASLAGLVDFGPQERNHDEGIEIAAEGRPPVGGTHSPAWQNCGIYDQPVEAKYAVHSMEHGAVWITYNPELPAADVEALRGLARGRTYVLLSPYPGLDSDVVLSAWGVQLGVESASDERIAQFIEQYRLGPQTPEYGAACDGGVGRPIG